MNQIIFVIDPMCSWCWGFHPIIEELRKKYSNRYCFSVVVGGLRTKGDMIWNKKSKHYLAQNWNAVHSRTQQSFNFSLLNRDFFEYDTYPACKAIVTVRELWGEEASFEYLSKIQEAFYAHSIDITHLERLSYYIDEKKKDNFLEFYRSPRAEVLMQHDFSKARSMGANAFPSIVKIDSEGHMICQKGYQTIDTILKL